MAPPSWQHSEDGANALDTSPPKPRAEVKPPPFAMHDNAPSAFYSKRDELVHEQGPAQASESRKLRESFKNRNNSGGDNILSWGEDVKKPMPLGVVASARRAPPSKEDSPPEEVCSTYRSAREAMMKNKQANRAASGMFDVMNH